MLQSLKNRIIKYAVHTKHTITLDRFGTMLDCEDHAMAKRRNIWIPKAWMEQGYESLMVEFSVIISKNEINKVIKDFMMQVNIYNKINSLLPSLYWCLYIKPEEKHLTYFKEYYGVECKGAEELQLILDEIKRLASKYKELFSEKEGDAQNKDKFNFSKLVVGIEIVLDRSLNRNIKLYELENYYHLAIERSKKNEHGRD